MKELNHLSEIFNEYDTFVIDLWGVMHNGIRLNKKAVDAVDKLKKNSKKIVFLSNAPRPSQKVINFLLEMKMDKKYLSNVMTSGEAAMQSINENKFGTYFFHLGPQRDASVFIKVQENKTNIENCDFILCTGLFDDHKDDLNYYKKLLIKHTSKKLICTNPDLTVHRGVKEEFCAGYIAKVFEELGGKVIYYGKPYKEIYKMCFKEHEKVLAIGDNLRTDIKGANNMKLDSLLITAGIHKKDFLNLPVVDYDKILNKYETNTNYYQESLNW